jgi:hypothetical protein
MYKIDTGKSNCRQHLKKCHKDEYDNAIRRYKWSYCLSTKDPAERPTIGKLRKHALPPFSSETFINYLVRFIVADDQVSNLLSLTTSSRFPSRYVLWNALNSVTCVCSFAEAYKTAISPIGTDCRRPP